LRGELKRKALQQDEDASASDSLTARVTQISTRPRGELVITLDNRQVWAQTGLDPDFRLEVGDQITVRTSAFGSFRLFGSSRRFIRVTRVQ